MKSIFKFGRKHFTDFKTFDDVCKANGTTETEFNERFGNIGFSNRAVNYEKIILVVKCINQGWAPDWNNIQQRKYYPWFDVSPSGLGFSGSGYDCDFTYAGVGSRLCFKDEETSNHAARTFPKIFIDFITAKF